MGRNVLNILSNIANALEGTTRGNSGNDNIPDLLMDWLKMIAFLSTIAGAIFGLIFSLAILIYGVPWLGIVLTVAISDIFWLVFAALYPEDFMNVGESIILFGNLLLTLADEVYDISRENAGTYDWIFDAVLFSFNPVYSLATVPAKIAGMKFGIFFALGIIALIASILLLTSSQCNPVSVQYSLPSQHTHSSTY